MKLLFYFLFLFHLLKLNVYSQDIKSVKTKLVADLKPKAAQYSWKLSETKKQIELNYIDTFYINTSISPLNNRNGILNELDTIYIKIRLEDDWTQHKYDSIKYIQKSILDSLSKKFIAHYDSLEWIGIKLNKYMFSENRYSHLLWWDGLSQTEKYQLKHFTRLPEKRIGSVGLFTESNYGHCYLEIQPESVNIKINTAYKSFAEVLGWAALNKCEDYY